MLNLDGVRMFVSSTAANGVVGSGTRLHFIWSSRPGSGVNVFDELPREP